MTFALIGLGSNLGDRLENLAEALRRLETDAGVLVERVSPAFESAPWGESDQPLFANAVARVDTDLGADALLDWCKVIEHDMGRRPGPPNGPRVIDIDILLFGDEEWRSSGLTIPHPRMLEREFVMVPLSLIAPDARMPDGTPLRTLAGRANEGRILGELGRVPFGEDIPPDVEPAVLEAAEEAARNAPDTDTMPEVSWDVDEEWVSLWQAPRSAAGGVVQLKLLMQRLHSEGVPAVLDPPDSYSHTGAVPYLLDQPVRLLVPESFLSRARDVLGG